MRDPTRIDRVLGAVRQLWKQYPDMRLCQLLTSAALGEGEDLFYVEDDQLLVGLARMWATLPAGGTEHTDAGLPSGE